MPEDTVLTDDMRDKLFAKLRTEAEFRELIKKDWRKALDSAGIKPTAVAKGILSRNDIVSIPGRAASWTIEIVISGRIPNREDIELKEAVAFEARK